MKKKSMILRFLFVFLCTALLIGVVACNSSGGGEDEIITLRFAHVYPVGNSIETWWLEPFQAKMTERTNGRVVIENFPAGTLLDSASQLDGVIDGVADMAYITKAHLPGRFNETLIFDMPGLNYVSARAASHALAEYVRLYEPEEYKGFINLGNHGCGPGAFISTRPIRTLEDLQGLLVATNVATGRGLTALGAAPVNIVSPERYEALRSGLMDANVGTPIMLTDFVFYEVCDYMTMYPFSNTGFFIAMNEARFNGLPADIQRHIMEAAAEVWEETQTYYFDIEVHKALTFAEERGMEVINLSDAEQERWLPILRTVLDEYAIELDNMGYDGQLIKQRAIELTEKWNAIYPTIEPLFDWQR